MTALPITPPSTARVGTGPKGSSPPPGAAADFAALLNQTSARTASAEGPKTRPAQPESRRRDAAAPKDDNKGADPDGMAAAAAQAAQVEDRPGTGGKAAGEAQDQPSAGEPSTPAPSASVSPAGDAAAMAAGSAVASAVAPTPASEPAMAGGSATAAAATPLTPAAATGAGAAMTAASATALSAAGTAPSDAAAQPGSAPGAASSDGAPAGPLPIPAELLGAKGGQAKDFKNSDQPKGDLPPAPTLPPTADAAATPASAAAPAPAVADPGAAAPTAPTFTTQAQPAATPQTAVPMANGGAGGPVLTRASVLQTAERVQELVRIATTRAGNARATLQLRPAELGQVDVHLRTTRNGLVATIAAHDQVGLDALQQAGNELRRSLEDRGVQLHSLDLQLGAGQHDFSNQGDAREANSGRRGAASSHDLGGEDPTAEGELTITHAPSTPAGALVDVQA